jgi:parallel beta-helix repeat protein
MAFSTPGVFNVLDDWLGGVGMQANNPAAAAQNANVLQAIIGLAQNANTSGCLPGGPNALAATILFPGNSDVPAPVGTGPFTDLGAEYFIAVPSAPGPTVPNAAVAITCNWPLRFVGTGNVRITMVVGDYGFGDIFLVESDVGMGNDIPGITFEGLEFRYEDAGGVTEVAAIHVPSIGVPGAIHDGAQNVRINRCVFLDCPIAVWFQRGLQCSMFQCTVNLATIGGTGLKIGGPGLGEGVPGVFAKDIFITDCIFEVSSPSSSNVGLDLISAEHVRLKSVRFDGFDLGIQIRPGYAGPTTAPSGLNVDRCFFTDVNVFVGQTATAGLAGTALTIQPQSTNQQIGQLTFVGCTFEPGDNMDITSTEGAGITVDANGSFIDTVRFVSCYSARWTGPGLSIGIPEGTGTLQNIEVLGGMYAGNNLGTGVSCGIAIYGPASAVRIAGTSCVGKYRFVTHATSAESNQQLVGIYVESGASQITINGCDIRENADYGIVVNAASDVVISGCNLSSNAVGSSGAGVQVNAGASNVVIDGCDVTSNGTNGIQVVATSGAVTGVYIRNCNASGYSSYNVAIYVDATGTNASTVQVTNCAGYNDQHPLLRGVPPTSATVFYNYTYGYFGPVEFYTAPQEATITYISVDGNITRLTMGSFLLVPGEYAEITWAAVGVFVPSFFMIGK